VDEKAQVIVAADVTQETNDKQQLAPMLSRVVTNCGAAPAAASTDSGYFSEANVTEPALVAIDLYVPSDRQKHGWTTPPTGMPAPIPLDAPVSVTMRGRLQTAEGHAIYARRKTVVEPVFGQVKEPRGFRRLSFRGVDKIREEWLLICLTQPAEAVPGGNGRHRWSEAPRGAIRPRRMHGLSMYTCAHRKPEHHHPML